MDTLPVEITCLILRHLRLAEIRLFLLTSTKLWSLTSHDIFWQTLLRYTYPDVISFHASSQHRFITLHRCCHVKWYDYEMMTSHQDIIFACILGYLIYTCQGGNIVSSTYQHPNCIITGNVDNWDVYIAKYCISNLHDTPCCWYTIMVGDNIRNRSYGYANLYAQPSDMMLSVIRAIIPGTGYYGVVHEFRQKYVGARIKRKLVSAFTI